MESNTQLCLLIVVHVAAVLLSTTSSTAIAAGILMSSDVVPASLRALRQSVTSASANITAVATADELLKALERGDEHVELRAHLDMTRAGKPQQVFYGMAPSLKTLRGNCSADVPLTFIRELDGPLLAPLLRSQCLLITDRELWGRDWNSVRSRVRDRDPQAAAMAGAVEAQFEEQLWVDGLYFRIRRSGRGAFDELIAVQPKQALWITSCIFQGDGDSREDGNTVLTIQSQAYLEGCTFMDFDAETLVSVERFGRVYFNKCLFQDNAAIGVLVDEQRRARSSLITSSADSNNIDPSSTQFQVGAGYVKLEQCTFTNNTADSRLAAQGGSQQSQLLRFQSDVQQEVWFGSPGGENGTLGKTLPVADSPPELAFLAFPSHLDLPAIIREDSSEPSDTANNTAPGQPPTSTAPGSPNSASSSTSGADAPNTTVATSSRNATGSTLGELEAGQNTVVVGKTTGGLSRKEMSTIIGVSGGLAVALSACALVLVLGRRAGRREPTLGSRMSSSDQGSRSKRVLSKLKSLGFGSFFLTSDKQASDGLYVQAMDSNNSLGPTAVTMQLPDRQPPASNASHASRMEYLHYQLDTLRGAEVLAGLVFQEGTGSRARGGQAVVQFAQNRYNRQEAALKFFLSRSAFEKEAAQYTDTHSPLRRFLPQCHDVVDNDGDRLVDGNGRRLPPCIVMEKGESLDRWVQRNIHGLDQFTCMQIIHHICECLTDLHCAGYVHRDLKPANIMWLPSQNHWTLIDFGCAARIGEEARTGFTLAYAAPEAVAAYFKNDGSRVTASTALDAWSLGVLAVELFNGRPTLSLMEGRKKVVEQVLGYKPLPWEAEGKAKELLHRAGRFKDPLLSLLHRDPQQRGDIPTFMYECAVILSTTTQQDGDVQSAEVAELAKKCFGRIAGVYEHQAFHEALSESLVNEDLSSMPLAAC